MKELLTLLCCLQSIGLAAAGAEDLAVPVPRDCFLGQTQVAAVKVALKTGDQELLPIYHQVLRDAETALQVGSVLCDAEVNQLPPSGDKHDYMSVGPYWWPDPSKPDGLPYIRRDGEVNPEYHSADFDNGASSATRPTRHDTRLGILPE